MAVGLVLIVSIEARGADTFITPSISTVGSYISNIGYSSTTSGASGGDYSVSLNPQVMVRHSDPILNGSVFAGLSATRFINNPQFSFVGTNGGFSFTLDNLVKKLDQRMSLYVSDVVSYTPQQPSFLVPQAEEGPQGTDLRGFQSSRANTLTNTAMLSTGYVLTPRLSAYGNFNHTLVHFGSALAAPGVGGFFDTFTYSAGGGLRYSVTQQDNVSLGYSYSTSSFDALGPGVQTSNYASHSVVGTWGHTFNQYLTGSLTGTTTLVTPGNDIVYGGTASLRYLVGKTTFATISFSRNVSPATFGAGAPVISNVVTAVVSHGISQRLYAAVNAFYAKNESTPSGIGGSGALNFSSYSVGGNLSYSLTRYISAFSAVTYVHNQQELQSTSATFSVYTVTLGLSAGWPYKWS